LVPKKKLRIYALLDSGASACFIDEEFTKRHKIPLVKKPTPVHVEAIDGRALSSGDVTHETKPLEVLFEGHRSTIIFNVIKTPSNPLIVGLSWLEKYNPVVDWKSQSLSFSLETSVIRSSPKPSNITPILIGAKAFIKATRKSDPYIIYATPMSEKNDTSSSIPIQYNEFGDVFKKKNADILLEH